MSKDKHKIIYTQRDFKVILRNDENTDQAGMPIIQFELSNEQADRYNTIIPFDNWELENYRLNPILAYNHYTGTADPNNIIGNGVVVEDGENRKLIGIPEFKSVYDGDTADIVNKKVQNGTLRAVSVGFVPLTEGRWGNPEKGEDENVYIFGKVELIEFSIVDVPANAAALMRSMQIYVNDQARTHKKTIDYAAYYAQKKARNMRQNLGIKNTNII